MGRPEASPPVDGFGSLACKSPLPEHEVNWALLRPVFQVFRFVLVVFSAVRGWPNLRLTERFLDRFQVSSFYTKFGISGFCFSSSGGIFRLSGAFCVDSIISRSKIPPGGRFWGQDNIFKENLKTFDENSPFFTIKDNFHNKKNREIFSKKSNFSGGVRTHANVPKCIRLHPNASERIRTDPNTFKNVRKRRKLHENFTKLRENFANEGLTSRTSR